MIAGTCVYCSCQEQSPCPGGCAWTDDSKTLCTACLDLETFAKIGVRALHEAAAKASPRIQLVTAAWADLAFEQRQLLVRGMLGLREQLAGMAFEELADDAADALVSVGALQEFLAEHVPAEQRLREEPLSDTIIRLLTPHVGSRIVVPGGRPC